MDCRTEHALPRRKSLARRIWDFLRTSVEILCWQVLDACQGKEYVECLSVPTGRLQVTHMFKGGLLLEDGKGERYTLRQGQELHACFSVSDGLVNQLYGVYMTVDEAKNCLDDLNEVEKHYPCGLSSDLRKQVVHHHGRISELKSIGRS